MISTLTALAKFCSHSKLLSISLAFPLLLVVLGCDRLHATPHSLDSLTIGVDEVPQTTDSLSGPARGYFDIPRMLNCYFFRETKAGSLSSEVVERFQWNTKVDFQFWIRENFYFSNGIKVTKSDILSTLDKWRSEKNGPIQSFVFDPVSASFKIKLIKPDPYFLSRMTRPILPKERAIGTKPVNDKNFESCGRYKIAELSPDKLVLSANALYPDSALPPGRTIVFRKFSPPTTSALGLYVELFDLVDTTLHQNFIRKITKTNPNWISRKMNLNSFQTLGINFQNPILAQKSMRHAMSLALDRDLMQRILNRNFGLSSTIGTELFSKTLLKYDPLKAKELLTDRNHESWDFKFICTDRLQEVEIAKSVASQFSKHLNIKTTIKIVTANELTKILEQGKADFWLQNNLKGTPVALEGLLHSSKIPPFGKNYGRFINMDLDNYFQHSDPNSKQSLDLIANKPLDLWLTEELPFLSLWQNSHLIFARNSIDFPRDDADIDSRDILETNLKAKK